MRNYLQQKLPPGNFIVRVSQFDIKVLFLSSNLEKKMCLYIINYPPIERFASCIWTLHHLNVLVVLELALKLTKLIANERNKRRTHDIVRNIPKIQVVSSNESSINLFFSNETSTLEFVALTIEANFKTDLWKGLEGWFRNLKKGGALQGGRRVNLEICKKLKGLQGYHLLNFAQIVM